jgi:D-alanyl-D-alanine dipeptidase
MFDLDHRIPIIDPEVYAGSYTGIGFDTADQRFHDPLVRLESVGVAYESHHARTDGGNWPYHRPIAGARKDTWLRKSAAEKLARVNAWLEPFGAELFVLDGYRSVACQRGLWQFYRDEGARVSESDLEGYALGRVFDPTPFSPDDPASWPAHTTGASVDVTLRDLRTHKVFDMGVRFEDICPEAANDHFERELDAGRIDARNPHLWNRRLIHWAMSAEGFVNDPFVFWHYDWGNQLYIKVSNALFADAPKLAWYSYIAAPPPQLVQTA